MKTIPLTRGKIAIVDDEDYARVSRLKWCAVKEGSRWYGTRGIGEKKLQMHRFILNLSLRDGKITDHIDRNGLNNQKSNLRLCTANQNSYNRIGWERSTSKYKGVGWHKLNKRWVARIKHNNKDIHLGYFDTEIEAAKARDHASKQYQGEFAYLNFPEGGL